MLSVSDDDVRKRLLEKPCFELAAKGVFRLGRCYIFGHGVPGFGPTTGKARLPTVDRLTVTGGKTIDACTKPGRLALAVQVQGIDVKNVEIKIKKKAELSQR